MKLYAKILPRYFEQLKSGEKEFDYRQLESITFYNSETGEELEFEIEYLCKVVHSQEIADAYPDIDWDLEKPIYQFRLGRRSRWRLRER